MFSNADIHAIDTHTGGEPTRVVVSGFPKIRRETMVKKKEYVSTHHDRVREALMHEPRGHKDMLGAIITEAVSKEADFGVIFMDGGGYLDMCGDGAISVMTVAIETGIIKKETPVTNVKMDTPAGLIKGKIFIEHDRVQKVSFENVPSFLYKKRTTIDVPSIGCVEVSISFGGNFFIMVDAKKLGIHVVPSNLEELIKLSAAIKEIVNREIVENDPYLASKGKLDLVKIFEREESERLHYKNIVIFGEGRFDRSPCGTGTSAKLADLYAEGKIALGEILLNESILSTKFEGKIVSVTETEQGFDAIIPEITGSAYITGFNRFVFDDKDPFTYGFELSKRKELKSGELKEASLDEAETFSTHQCKTSCSI